MKNYTQFFARSAFSMMTMYLGFVGLSLMVDIKPWMAEHAVFSTICGAVFLFLALCQSWRLAQIDAELRMAHETRDVIVPGSSFSLDDLPIRKFSAAIDQSEQELELTKFRRENRELNEAKKSLEGQERTLNRKVRNLEESVRTLQSQIEKAERDAGQQQELKMNAMADSAILEGLLTDMLVIEVYTDCYKTRGAAFLYDRTTSEFIFATWRQILNVYYWSFSTLKHVGDTFQFSNTNEHGTWEKRKAAPCITTELDERWLVEQQSNGRVRHVHRIVFKVCSLGFDAIKPLAECPFADRIDKGNRHERSNRLRDDEERFVQFSQEQKLLTSGNGANDDGYEA